MKRAYTSLLLLLMCCLLHAQSQIPILEREISLKVDNESVQYVLDQIATQADFTFSYSPGQINTSRRISLDIRKKSVRFALNAIFGAEVEFKPRGKYLILKAVPPAKKEEKNPATIVEGYLYDAQTGERLSEASVYSKQQLASAITDQYGYFRLQVPAGESSAEIQVSKQGYQDTLLIDFDKPTHFIDLELTGNPADPSDTLSHAKAKFHFPSWLVHPKILIHQRNITDTLYTRFQLSLAPLLNTNKLFSGRTVTDYSLNATVGFTKEVRVFEAGAIANIVTGNASRVQLAGVGNYVGGIMNGFQTAGVINVANQVNGFQVAGVLNMAKEIDGIQVAGIMNSTLSSADVQVAGILNFTPYDSNFQMAGIMNLAAKVNNIQGAGIANLAKEVEGIQVAGIANAVGQVKGVQVAGVLNLAKEVDGIQVAGIMNGSLSNVDAQVGGILNFTPHESNLQLAGIMNLAGKINNIQGAGIANLAMEVEGIQTAGILNVAGSVSGIQLAGICNRASAVSVLQASSIYNDADSIMGLQAVAILNRTSFLKGVQLGLINIADSSQGVPIGLLSFVRRGGHNKLELYSDEMFMTNAAIRLGVKRFHNIIMFGKFHQNFQNPVSMLGYGLGTSFRLSPRLSFDIDYFDQSLIVNGRMREISSIKRLNTTLDWHISRRFSMFGGPTYNLLSPLDNSAGLWDGFKPPYNLIDNSDLTNKGLQFWIGAKFGLRFF
jgi:hypothetical protein